MTQVHETYNLTPFTVGLSILPDSGLGEQVIAVLKASFDFDDHGRLSVAPQDRMLPVWMSDQFHSPDGHSSVRYPTDVTPFKDGTDIVVNGNAYGHGQERVACGFALGRLNKILTATGHRTWNRILTFHTITGPFSFEKIPVAYENAFGGQYEDKKGIHRYEFNPVGKGFGAKHVERALLPNIEYRDFPVKSIDQKPHPAGLGAIPAFWAQRLVYAGTYDDAWKRNRFPLPPADMNPLFHNAVPQDQVYRPKLEGNEPLTLFNLHRANPQFKLNIPNHSFTAIARIKNETLPKPMKIDTCLIEPDENRLTLTFAARFLLPMDSRYVKSVHFMEI